MLMHLTVISAVHKGHIEIQKRDFSVLSLITCSLLFKWPFSNAQAILAYIKAKYEWGRLDLEGRCTYKDVAGKIVPVQGHHNSRSTGILYDKEWLDNPDCSFFPSSTWVVRGRSCVTSGLPLFSTQEVWHDTQWKSRNPLVNSALSVWQTLCSDTKNEYENYSHLYFFILFRIAKSQDNLEF